MANNNDIIDLDLDMLTYDRLASDKPAVEPKPVIEQQVQVAPTETIVKEEPAPVVVEQPAPAPMQEPVVVQPVVSAPVEQPVEQPVEPVVQQNPAPVNQQPTPAAEVKEEIVPEPEEKVIEEQKEDITNEQPIDEDLQQSAGEPEPEDKEEIVEEEVTEFSEEPEAEVVEEENYGDEKFEALKEVTEKVGAVLTHGINANKYLEEKANAKLDEEADKELDINFFEGEVQYDPEFEDVVRTFGPYNLTYRKLYEKLYEEIYTSLTNTDRGQQLCYKYVVQTPNEYTYFTNIIFSIIKAGLEDSSDNLEYDSIKTTALYLNVPEVTIDASYSKESFAELIDYAADISYNFFSNAELLQSIQKEFNEEQQTKNEVKKEEEKPVEEAEEVIEQPEDKETAEIIPEVQPKEEIVPVPEEKPVENKSEQEFVFPVTPPIKQEIVNKYQEIFEQYGGKIAVTEDGKIFAVDKESEMANADDEIKEIQDVACTWFCLVCRFYKIEALGPDDWKALERFLECIKETPKDTFAQDIIEVARNKGFDDAFTRTAISIEPYMNTLVNHVRNNVIKTLMKKQNGEQ